MAPVTDREAGVTALGLCSGGLDSTLAGLVLRRQGIRVQWIAFETPFFAADKARRAASQTGIPLRVQDITAVYLDLLRNPRCGFGRHMNPCPDCHALMFRLAGEHMRRDGHAFLFSGEVLGQRPMSQTRPSLRYVEKRSGCEGFVLRPLSALRLPPTEPEKQGLVDRARLLGIAGRGRKEQIRLAAEFGLTDYPAPAGGCLLTDAGFSRRLRDLLAREADPPLRHLHLLRHGRHLRLDDDLKLIVGRTQADNRRLLRHADPGDDTLLAVDSHPGPVGVLRGRVDATRLERAAAVCAGYSKVPPGAVVQVRVTTPHERRRLRVHALAPDRVADLLI